MWRQARNYNESRSVIVTKYRAIMIFISDNSLILFIFLDKLTRIKPMSINEQQLTLDRIDRQILQVMQGNARISNLELAEAVGLSPTPCARRVRRLEQEKVIERHVTLLNQATLGLNITAMISITMDRHTPDRFENFEQQVQQFPEVIECAIVTGQAADYLLKAVLPDMTYYEEFLLGRLTRIEGVTGVHSSFVLRHVVNRTELPLDHVG